MASKFEDRSMFVVFAILGIAILFTITYALMSNQAGEGDLLLSGEDEHGCNLSEGYSWCEVKDKCLRTWEEECPSAELSLDAVYLNDLKAKILETNAETEISEVNSDTFDWLMNDMGMIFADGRIGSSLKLKNISNDLLAAVKVELEADGFVIDEYNLTAGTSVSRSGYMNDDLICVLNEEVMNMDEASETVPALYRLEIYCGLNE